MRNRLLVSFVVLTGALAAALALSPVVCEDHLIEDHGPRAKRGEAKP